jgi:hypothetical protein
MSFNRYVVDATIMLQAVYTELPNNRAQSVSHSPSSLKGCTKILGEKGFGGLVRPQTGPGV